MSKSILITGASRGFGMLMSNTLIDNGHKVFASMRNPETRNKAAKEALEAKGAHVLDIDVTDENSVVSGVAEAVKAAGGLDASSCGRRAAR